MIKKVIETYEVLNTELLETMPVNDPKTRKFIKDRLELELKQCEIICDETNNSPDLIDSCVAIAKVMWAGVGYTIHYVDLVFGSPEQIKAVQPILNQFG